jgi:Delta7-sterol 5-desaturase
MHPYLKAIIAPETVWGSFVVLAIGGLLFFPITSGSSWLYYCVLRRERFFPNEDPAREREQRPREWKWSVYNVVGHAAFTAPIHHLVVKGHSKVYFDVADRGLPYFFASVVLILAVTEPLVYWAHRILHHPWLYKHIHLHHHQFRTPSPWTSMAFHPVDSFMQAIPHHVCAFLFPVHVGVYVFFIVFLQIWSTWIHERVTWVRHPLVNFTACHTLHHKLNKFNYGQFFTLADRLWGTYKPPYGVVYDGVEQATMRAPAERAAQAS